MLGNVVIHAGVDRPLPEPQRNGTREEDGVNRGKTASDQGDPGHGAAYRKQAARADLPQDQSAGRSGNGGTERNDGRDEAAVAERDRQRLAHGNPGGIKDLVREPEADVAEVDDDEQDDFPACRGEPVK